MRMGMERHTKDVWVWTMVDLLDIDAYVCACELSWERRERE